MWGELCCQYFDQLNQDEKSQRNRIASLSLEKLETLCLYGEKEPGDFDAPDKYYETSLREEVRKVLTELVNRFTGKKIKKTSQSKINIFSEQMPVNSVTTRIVTDSPSNGTHSF